MKKKYLIVGNWKLHPGTREEAKKIFLATRRAAEKHSAVVSITCPPFPFVRDLAALAAKRKNLFVGAQNCFFEERGAYTGEVSAPQLADSGARYVIVGHSERRAMGETDEVVNKKLKSVLRAGMTAIVCVGESARDTDGRHLAFVKGQIDSMLMGVGAVDLDRVIVAYEPVWAIGKSEREAMTPHNLHEMAIFIRKTVAAHYGPTVAFSVPVLYGGSVGPTNACEHLSAGVDGLLIGRASANAEDIVTIINSVPVPSRKRAS